MVKRKISRKRKNPVPSETLELLEWLKNTQEIIESRIKYLDKYQFSIPDRVNYEFTSLNQYSKFILRELKKIKRIVGDLEYNIPDGKNGQF